MQFSKPVLSALLSLVLAAAGQFAMAQDCTCGQQATNSGQLVPPALLAIDDKSPLAQSTSDQESAEFTPDGIIAADRAAVSSDLPSFVTSLSRNSIPLTSMTRTALTDEQKQIAADEKNAFKIDPAVRAYILASELPQPQSIEGYAPQLRDEERKQLFALHTSVSKVVGGIPPAVLARWKQQIHALYQKDIVTALFYGAAGVRTAPVTQFDERIEYSDALFGYDLLAETDNSNPRSLSLGFRLDLSPTRQSVLSRVGGYQSYNERQRLEVKIPEGSLAAQMAYVIVHIQPELRIRLRSAKQAIIARQQGLHLLAFSGYSTVNGYGSLFAYGISASALRQFEHTPGGFTGLGSIEIVGRENTVVPGGAFFWQDAVSHQQNGDPAIVRWRKQIGIEYSSLSAFHHLHEIYDLFFRYRLPRYAEIKFTAGVDPTNSLIVGFEIGQTVGLTRSNNVAEK